MPIDFQQTLKLADEAISGNGHASDYHHTYCHLSVFINLFLWFERNRNLQWESLTAQILKT